MNETPGSRNARARNVEREAREFLDYHLQPVHKLVARLEDGDVPTFSPRLLMPSPTGRPRAKLNGGARGGQSDAPARSFDDDPEFHAAVERLRRTWWFRLRFAWAQLRHGARFPV